MSAIGPLGRPYTSEFLRYLFSESVAWQGFQFANRSWVMTEQNYVPAIWKSVDGVDHRYEIFFQDIKTINSRQNILQRIFGIGDLLIASSVVQAFDYWGKYLSLFTWQVLFFGEEDLGVIRNFKKPIWLVVSFVF